MLKYYIYYILHHKTHHMNLASAAQLATQLMEEHGLLSQKWHFCFDRAKYRFGCCKYTSKEITLSRALTELNDEHLVRDTILHEIAHALTPGAGHGPVWRAKAKEIGCTGDRCYSNTEVQALELEYMATCGVCGLEDKRSKRPPSRASCGRCSGRSFNPAYEINYTLNPNFSK